MASANSTDFLPLDIRSQRAESPLSTDALVESSIPRQGTVVLDTLPLTNGDALAPVMIAFERWGTLAPAHDNVILLCHALTGDAHARDDAHEDDPRAGWWNPLIGPGKVFDTNRFCVICSNILGGCYGTTGPTSLHPADGQPYRLRFPLISVGDMVHAQAALLRALGISRLYAVAGGSVGGLQALEWAIAAPMRVERAIIIAASPRLGTRGLAIDDIARQAIMGDPAWNGGDYPADGGPVIGLGIARMLGMLTYTSPEGLDQRFGRQLADRESHLPPFGPRLAVETYLHHQAQKLVRRFDANTYLYLSSAMDRYDAAAGRGGDREALARIRARVLCVGIDTDWLFPAADVRAMAEAIRASGGDATYRELRSVEGHDAFLKEWDQLDATLRPWIADDRLSSY